MNSSILDSVLKRQTTDHLVQDDGGLMQSFAFASLLVLVGVSSSWIYLKYDSSDLSLDLPAINSTVRVQSAPIAVNRDMSWLEQADAAFAAGRVASPENNSALYFYQLAAAESKEDTDANIEAQQGLDRVIGYLVSHADGAIFRNDWAAARGYITSIEEAVPNHSEATLMAARVSQLEKVEGFTQLAVKQMTENRLTAPKGDNALATYQKILAVDPKNNTAIQGIASIAQRLLANAQSAAFADDHERAKRFVAIVKRIQPNAPGLAETEKLTKQWDRLVKNQSRQGDLGAAADALQANRLVSPAGDNALELFQNVLKHDKNSEAARRGLLLVADALVDQSWTLVRAGDFDAAKVSITDAKKAGVSDSVVEELNSEIAYQQKIAAARGGRFDRIYSTSDLTVRKQVAPEFPRKAETLEIDGWVELRFTVDVDGKVVDSKVHSSSDEVFERSALNAVSKWRFEPFIEEGRTVPVRSGLRFTFTR